MVNYQPFTCSKPTPTLSHFFISRTTKETVNYQYESFSLMEVQKQWPTVKVTLLQYQNYRTLFSQYHFRTISVINGTADD